MSYMLTITFFIDKYKEENQDNVFNEVITLISKFETPTTLSEKDITNINKFIGLAKHIKQLSIRDYLRHPTEKGGKMKQKLYDMLQIIEKHFKNEVWNSEPPLKKIDYKLLMLGIDIIKIMNNIDDGKDIGIEISTLMANIEKDFNIPLVEQDIDQFINQDKIPHKVVIDVYKALSSLNPL